MYFLEKFCEGEELHKATHDYVTLCEAFQDYAVLMYILHSEALDFFLKKYIYIQRIAKMIKI